MDWACYLLAGAKKSLLQKLASSSKLKKKKKTDTLGGVYICGWLRRDGQNGLIWVSGSRTMRVVQKPYAASGSWVTGLYAIAADSKSLGRFWLMGYRPLRNCG